MPKAQAQVNLGKFLGGWSLRPSLARGRVIADVVVIARGKRLPAARGCRASTTRQVVAADAPHAFVGDAGS
jgi:hypothetical protein